VVIALRSEVFLIVETGRTEDQTVLARVPHVPHGVVGGWCLLALPMD
jgi:hypothetical protein